MTRTFETRSDEETIELGRRLAASLAPPRLVLLTGDLGAGKTTLVKGIAEGFSAATRDGVTSPTFTLVHEYRGPQVDVYHVDLYRLETERELETLGLDDLMGGESVLLVEWGERFPTLASRSDAAVAIERTGENERRITVRMPDDGPPEQPNSPRLSS